MPSKELLQLWAGWSAELKCSAVVEDEEVFKNVFWNIWGVLTPSQVKTLQLFAHSPCWRLLSFQLCSVEDPASFFPGKATHVILNCLLFPFELSHVSWSETGWKLLVWLSHSSFSRKGTCSCFYMMITVLWISIADQNEGSLQDL